MQVFKLNLSANKAENLELLSLILKLMRYGHKGPHQMSRWYRYKINGIKFRTKACVIPTCMEQKTEEVK